MKSGLKTFTETLRVSDVETWFDTSEFDARHPSGIQTNVNKKQIGMMKDEAGGKIIQEFVGLRAKQYSFKMFIVHETNIEI